MALFYIFINLFSDIIMSGQINPEILLGGKIMKTENTQENTPQVKEDLKLLNAPLHIKRSLAELGNDKD